MAKRFARLSGTFDQVQRSDLLFLNNPVLIQGLGLSPVIMAANSLRNAVILAIAAALLCTLTRWLCSYDHNRIAPRLRGMTYSITSAIIYIPVLFLLQLIFRDKLDLVGIYLPLLVVDQLIVARGDSMVFEHPDEAFRNGFIMSVGFAGVIIITGALRELLSAGTLWGAKIFAGSALPVMSTAVGGFVAVALLAALLQSLINYYKKEMARRMKHSVQ